MRRTSWEASRSDRHDFASTRARATSSASVSRAMDRCSSALRSSSIRSRKMRSTVVRSTRQENRDADLTHIPRPPACGGARRFRWGSRWPTEPALAGMRGARHLLAMSGMAEPVPPFLALVAPGEIAVTRSRGFEASHRFGRDGTSADRYGHASRLHAHNYVVSATIAGPIDPCTHFLVDFRSLDDLLGEAVPPLDHRPLDVEYAPLRGREPSTEAPAVVLVRAPA